VNRRERKKQETRQKIIKIAMYLFRKQGFDATTMEQIASDVDIAKGTLYNYFPVKEAIICDYWQDSVRELKLQILEMIQLLPDTRTRLSRTFIKAANELFKAKQDIYKIYLSYWFKNLNNPALSERLQSGFEDIFTMIIKLGQQSGDIRKDMPLVMLVRLLEVSFLTACRSWLTDPRLFPLEQSLSQVVSLFVEGAGPGRRRSKTKPGTKGLPGELSQEKLL
jgi:AcrR family transcriptional regulator